MLTAKIHLDYLKKLGIFTSEAPPKKFIFTFVGKFYREMIASYDCEAYQDPFSTVYRFKKYPDIAFGNFRIGAAVNAMKMEQLIYWGVKEFFAIGLAGAIDPHLRPGDLILAAEAIGEEGVSRYYVERPEKIRAPGASLSIWEENLVGTAYKKGLILSHDAIYRLTEASLQKRRKEGVLGVEMETAALYAVGQSKQVPIATALVISDFEGPEGWEIAFRDPKIFVGQFQFLNALLNGQFSAIPVLQT